MNEQGADRKSGVHLPSVDSLLNSAPFEPLISIWGRASIREAIRAVQTELRELNSTTSDLLSASNYSPKVEQWLASNRRRSYTRVFNVSGTILHTNLGRALIDPTQLESVTSLITHPATIEFDLDTGKRGQREAAVCERLCRLTNAEAASIVNNNAAAVMIALHTLANDKNVVVSRGELIEIGGSFRLPEVMTAAGCRLLEVGTTNRTHLKDYEAALDSNPALFLKAHPSNYRIEGFTQEVSAKSLSQLSNRSGVPTLVDLGSGALTDTRQFGLPKEPMPSDLLAAGIDLVTFSGDKLLGGPQAGLIVGSRTLIEKINANPMKRALRTSKITLALLEETLKAYEDPDQLVKRIPTIRLLTLSKKALQHRANQTQRVLAEVLPDDFVLSIETSEAEVGSGSMPGNSKPSIAVTIQDRSNQATQGLFDELRQLPTPIVGRLKNGAIYLDMHGAEPLGEFLDTLKHLR